MRGKGIFDELESRDVTLVNRFLQLDESVSHFLLLLDIFLVQYIKITSLLKMWGSNKLLIICCAI